MLAGSVHGFLSKERVRHFILKTHQFESTSPFGGHRHDTMWRASALEFSVLQQYSHCLSGQFGERCYQNFQKESTTLPSSNLLQTCRLSFTFTGEAAWQSQAWLKFFASGLCTLYLRNSPLHKPLDSALRLQGVLNHLGILRGLAEFIRRGLRRKRQLENWLCKRT